MTQFNLRCFSISLLLIFIETLIAVYISQGFIRFVVGDFLAAILLYCLLKSFFKIQPKHIALRVLLISFTVAFLQLLEIIKVLQLQNNNFLKIVLGTSFSMKDLIAYSLGVVTILWIDLITSSS